MNEKYNEWDWLTFLSSWHEKEYERRFTVENLVTTPVGILTGIYALIYLLITSFDFSTGALLNSIIFFLTLSIAVFSAVASAYFTYKSYAIVKEKTYRGIPKAVELRKHMKELIIYYNEHEPQIDGFNKFKEYYIDLLSEQIDINTKNNDDRINNIQKAKKPIMLALLFLLLSLPSFLVNHFSKPDAIYKIQIMSKKPSPPPPPPQREIMTQPPIKMPPLKLPKPKS